LVASYPPPPPVPDLQSGKEKSYRDKAEAADPRPYRLLRGID
jgi:hypothetical protein